MMAHSVKPVKRPTGLFRFPRGNKLFVQTDSVGTRGAAAAKVVPAFGGLFRWTARRD